MADGSITFSTELDNTKVERELSDLRKEIEKAEERLNKSSDEGLSKSIEDAKEAAGGLEKNLMRVQKLRLPVGYDQGAIEMVEAFAKGIGGATQETNELKAALDGAKLDVENLEKSGKWFGDEEYDAAIQKLNKINADLIMYKRELISSPKPQNPFGLDTIAGKIKEAEIALDRIKDTGAGLGTDEYDKAYRNLALLKDEARAYSAELAKTPAQLEKDAVAAEKAIQKQDELTRKKIAAEVEAYRLQIIAEKAEVSDQKLIELNKELVELQVRLTELKKAGLTAGYAEYDQTAKRIAEIKGEIKNYGNAVQSADKMDKATKKANKSMGRFAMRVREVVRSALVFTLITQALAKFREWGGKVIKTNSETAASISKLKAALLTMAQPLVEVVLPMLTKFTEMLTQIVMAIARVFSSLVGTTVEQSKESAESLKDETDALDDTGKAAKKAAKSLAAFDEINQLSGDTDEQKISATDTDFSGLSQFSSEDYKKKIDEITTYVSGALLALGAILTFSGANIPLGLGLMAAGAIGLAAEAKEHWGDIDGKIKSEINTILVTLGTALLVLGVVLAFSGTNVPLGIGLMIAGAASLAAAVALNWDYIKANVQTVIADLLVAVAAASLVIGIVFLFTGNVGIGLGLLAVSALSYFGATALGFSWDSIPPEIKTAAANTLIAVAFGALVIGIVFLFTGNIGAGLGLLLASVMSYYGATEAGFNWDAIPPEIRMVVSKVLVGIALGALVFGAIFLLTGHIGAGLGLLLVAAMSYWGATEAGFSWDSVPDKIREKISNALIIIADAALVFGVIFLLTGNFSIGLGLIAMSALSYWGATEAGVDWGATVAKVRHEIEVMLAIIGGAALVIGVILLFAGNIPLGLALIGTSIASFFGLAAVGSDNTWNAVISKVSGSLDDTKTEIEKHRDSLYAASKELGTGISDGVSSGVDSAGGGVGDAVAKSLESGVDAGNKAMDINSPAGVTEEQGDYMVAGWLLALENGKKTIGDKVTEIMDVIKGAVLGAQSSISSAFSGVFSSSSSGLSSKIASVSSMPTVSMMPASLPSLPALATGAVIPPNREFMAVLGDQKSGTNIEAPMGTIKQGIREVMNEMGITGGGQSGDLILQIDGKTFARLTNPYAAKENQRVGIKMVEGV
ncbi:hypothetical protein [Oscillibacter sp.]|uniref:hypothetical protein n=1 Tax=Oscillibacter sp. TaxID=1945593 RepID=UPI0028A0185A|nr:hypothetical protein [Oscillibacter sp.]